MSTLSLRKQSSNAYLKKFECQDRLLEDYEDFKFQKDDIDF